MALGSLEKHGVIVRAQNSQEITAAYPLSAVPTDHQVLLSDGRSPYAMCAIDALGVPFTFGLKARVTSRCHLCRRVIEVRLGPASPPHAEPPETVVFHNMRLDGVWAENSCPFLNFFCGLGHLEEWRRANGLETRGVSLTVQEATDRARAAFGSPIDLRGAAS